MLYSVAVASLLNESFNSTNGAFNFHLQTSLKSTAQRVNKKTLLKRHEMALESGVEMKPKLSLNRVLNTSQK